MDKVIVVGTEDRQYKVEKAFGGIKVDAPLLDTPMAVQVVPHGVFEDRQILTLEEAVKNVSGVQASPSGYYDDFLLRGFDNYADVFRNGLKLSCVIGAEDPAFIDRVEVVKGPTAMLYGRIQPGGLVNITTKEPQATPAFSVQQQAGSWGEYRTVVDATGSINADRTFLGRAIGVYDRGDGFIDFQHHENKAAAAFFSWTPSPVFKANFQFEAYDQKASNPGYTAQQIPFDGEHPAPVARSWSQSDPLMWTRWPNTVRRETIAFDSSLALGEKWSITQRSHYFTSDEVQSYLIFGTFDSSTSTLHRRIDYNPVTRDAFSNNLDLTGAFETGPLDHKFLLGADWYRYDEKFLGYNEDGSTPDTLPPSDIYHPTFQPFDGDAIQKGIDVSRNNVLWRSRSTDFGTYLQDRISFAERWDLLLGGRYDIAKDRYSSVYGTVGTPDYPNNTGAFAPGPIDRQFSPRAGLLYKISTNASVYSSYSQSFGTANGLNSTGRALPPEKAEQYELGTKAAWFDKRLLTSVTFFDLTKKNVVEYSPDSIPIVVGEVRSRGVELDASGRVTENISLIGSYTYDEAKITKDPYNGNQGHRFTGVAPHVASMWLKYDTSPGTTSGWAFGAGGYFSAERPADDANMTRVPGYGRMDAMVSYRTDVGKQHLLVQLNVQNLLDKTYYDNGAFGWAIYGVPRMFLGSVRLDF